MKKNTVLAALLACVLLVSGCSKTNNNPADTGASDTAGTTASQPADTSAPAAEPTEEPAAPAPAEEYDPAKLYVDFANGSSALFECSDGWSNGSMFNCTWRKKNVGFADGVMTLTIDTDGLLKPPYSGAEYRTKGFYGYGRYEVSMKPIKNDGVVSSLFTYTGPSDNNPWDEIDIEFLGKDTTKVQFNYFTDSRGNHEYVYDLGFDASEEFHTYGFEWHKDKIVWFVDGVEVYTAGDNIPSVPGKIMMNTWPGTGVDGWLNAFDDSSLPVTAEYQWVSFTAFDE